VQRGCVDGHDLFGDGANPNRCVACAVMVEVPVAEVALAANITDVFAPAAMANGLAGFTERVSGWLTPPWGMVIEDEERAKEKSAGGMAADCVAPPLQPERRKKEKSKCWSTFGARRETQDKRRSQSGMETRCADAGFG
jgi:hypothetical protein